jgi:hypothetical protein
MTATVAYRCDTVAMNRPTATVASLGGARTYVPTVADRHDLLHLAHARAHARGNILGAMGTVATVCDGAPGLMAQSSSDPRTGHQDDSSAYAGDGGVAYLTVYRTRDILEV